MKIAISSGHGSKVRGASGYLDEVDEARRVVEQLAQDLRNVGVDVITFHDDTSTTQSENLETIVDFHNRVGGDLDISVHFNAYQTTVDPMGTECLYLTQSALATDVAATIAEAGGFINRGPKERTDLYFLNNTNAPAILIEVCFVDSAADATLYHESFHRICFALASIATPTDPEFQTPKPGVRFAGTCSWFGGPNDDGVSPDEGLAFFFEYDDAPHLFLKQQPSGTTGLARRLNPDVFYVACRWDYDVTSKDMLADAGNLALVFAKRTGRQFRAWPADWGPHGDTNRVADISPGLMAALGIETDDEVVVLYG